MKSDIIRDFSKFVIRATLSGLLVCLSFRPIYAADFGCENPLPTPKGLVEGVEASYLKTSSITADFFQTSFFAGLDKKEASKGTVQFARPGKMNWDYQEPDPQRFVSDGSTIYFYQPKLNQVTLTSFKEAFSSELPVTFLLGLGSLSKSFNALGICKSAEGTLIKLAPKAEDASLSSFTLLVDKTSFSPLGAKIVDLGGNETSILLVAPKFNSSIPAVAFDFKIPLGVDVIDNRGGGSFDETQSTSEVIKQGLSQTPLKEKNTVKEENLVK